MIRKPSKKHISTNNKALTDVVASINKLEPKKTETNSNVTQQEETALQELTALTRTILEIKKADKTNTLVIMDKEEYREKLVLQCHLQTESYKEVEEGSDENVYKNLKKLCTKHRSCLTDNEQSVILEKDWRRSNLYVLPKINKSTAIIEEITRKNKEYIQMPMPDDLTSRPIVSGPKSVTKGLSKLLEKILTPLVGQLRTYIKDERHFLKRFPRDIGEGSYVICCDIKSLYTSIPNSLGLQAVEYWIDQLTHLIPARFSKEFIIEGTKFVLENNFFDFGNTTWHQVVGTAMGKEVASPYACLTVGFLEETILFPQLLPANFEPDIVQKIIELFFRFVDDGITALLDEIEPEKFQGILNQMDPSIQYTITKPIRTILRKRPLQRTDFLSLKVLVSRLGKISTDIYYKETNSHDYLHYSSHHPTHIKNNIPFVLAKSIIVMTTDDETMENNLKDLTSWLLNCGYPLEVISRGIRNARLQGPAPPPDKKVSIPLVTTYYSNFDGANILEAAKSLIQNSTNIRIKEAFKDVRFIHARRQPPNILQRVTNAKFITAERVIRPGIWRCGRYEGVVCKICELYLQECTSFTTANGKIWTVNCSASCNSLNVLYYLVCNFCNNTSYTGKTDVIRDRTNNHISCIRKGTGSNKFDKHVHLCSSNHSKPLTEPFFKLYIFMVMNDYSKLRNMERRLHLLNYDTMNATQQV